MDPLARLIDAPPRDADAERDPGFTRQVMDSLPAAPRSRPDLAGGWLWVAIAVAAGLALLLPGSESLPTPADLGDALSGWWELALATALLLAAALAVGDHRERSLP